MSIPPSKGMLNRVRLTESEISTSMHSMAHPPPRYIATLLFQVRVNASILSNNLYYLNELSKSLCRKLLGNHVTRNFLATSDPIRALSTRSALASMPAEICPIVPASITYASKPAKLLLDELPLSRPRVAGLGGSVMEGLQHGSSRQSLGFYLFNPLPGHLFTKACPLRLVGIG